MEVTAFLYHIVILTGCLNGGAQIRPASGESGRELVSQLEAMYSQLPQANPGTNKLVRRLYSEWLDGRDSDKAKAVLHTTYHAVEKSDIALNIKWWRRSGRGALYVTWSKMRIDYLAMEKTDISNIMRWGPNARGAIYIPLCWRFIQDN